MFLHLYRYQIKVLLKEKDLLFWNLLFPILLGTLFFAGFGNYMKDADAFQTIPVAVTGDRSGNETFFTSLDTLSKAESGETPLFEVTYCQKADAAALLEQGKVDGMIDTEGALSLTIRSEGINASILKRFLDQYQAQAALFLDTASKHPERLPALSEAMTDSRSWVTSGSVTGSNISIFTQYFFALLATTCLYGAFIGTYLATHLQADQSGLAARRTVSPTPKLIQIMADLLAALTLHMMEIVLVFCYLSFVIGVDFGNRIGTLFVICLFGSLFSISFGILLKLLIRNETIASGLAAGITMLLSFFSGLMFSGIKDHIEQHLPLFNRLNPAALICDALYCISVYNDTARLVRSLVILGLYALLFCTCSIFLMRRERYASL